VTGKDLNWFFNQWFFGAGHPKLNIRYSYQEADKRAMMIVEQQQEGNVFTLPVAVDVYTGATPTRHHIWVRNQADTFYFASATRPSLINFDAEKKLVAEKTENKSLDEYAIQYNRAANYIDRREAIDAALKKQAETGGVQILLAAMKDRYAPLLAYTINGLDMNLSQIKNAMEAPLADAAKDADRKVKAAAIAKLGTYRHAKYKPLFLTAVNDSSYTVAGNALEALYRIDSAAAVTEASRQANMNPKGKLATAIKSIILSGDRTAALKLLSDFEAMPLGQPKFQALNDVFELIAATNDPEIFRRGVDDILALGNALPEAFRDQAMKELTNSLRQIQKEKREAGLAAQAEYLETKLPKGF
jgi:aminopeptidase N